MLLMLLFASACGGAATSAPELNDPTEPYVSATEAPAATEAPFNYSPEGAAHQNEPQAPSTNSEVPQSNREPYDMFFKDYGVNPSIDTEDDSQIGRASCRERV